MHFQIRYVENDGWHARPVGSTIENKDQFILTIKRTNPKLFAEAFAFLGRTTSDAPYGDGQWHTVCT